ncbi:MAG: protein translocase subunit SecF [SAR202 cluster bacterium]|nr:protein translocase subunit SecF [Chloroflexota bacterium]MQG50454.1 protein translocase subunit SecF [SAR202 cluster bacterium]|tara:strand:+ start:37 stop:960 length:924 start_codon:yes stop_codon:yes gene_type:complete
MDIVKRRFWYFTISAVLLVICVSSLIVPPRLTLGIDFSGGSTMTVVFDSEIKSESVRERLNQLGYNDATVQQSGTNTVFVRMSKLEEGNESTGRKSDRLLIEEDLSNLARIESVDVATVSGVVANDTVNNAVIAVVVASIGILIYVTYSFRGVSNPFRYGVAAIVALIHDSLIVLGLFSLLGKFMGLEINAMFIPGILVVIGYSVNDTIVVFDRVRENASIDPDRPLSMIVNDSITQTIGRSLNTSVTLLLTIFALIFLGGESIRNFLYVLLIGLIVGTYSSIFIACQFLVMWEQGELRLSFGKKSK